jgi:hypothetical protein
MKVVIITEAFEVEVRPTTKATIDMAKVFVQSILNMDGDRRSPGRPRKASNSGTAPDECVSGVGETLPDDEIDASQGRKQP